jgi:glycopeptide antibiotics resistance protein
MVFKSIICFSEYLVVYDAVINHQVFLNEISAFPFESYLEKMKRKIHSGTYTVAQVGLEVLSLGLG